MKYSIALLCLFLLLTRFVLAQQLTLGTTPNVVVKSALLDLNSDKQGLLLPRISNYSVAPLSTAPDGMLIYSVTDKLLYIRKNGIWRKLIDETNSITSVNGQTGPVVSLTTNDISESVNLYYTDTRARSAFSAGTGINLSGAGVISALNTSALWNASQLQGRNISTNAPANNDVLAWDNATSTWLPRSSTAGSVTSVGLALPSIFTVSNSPVTSSGTLTGALASQTLNTVFAAPVAANGIPAFRALDPLDIPTLDVSKITSGILPIARGGTGIGTIGTAGQLVRVNPGATAYEFFTPSYLTANQTITLTGDVTGSGTTSIATTLANAGTAGTYTKVTTDAKGRVTSGTTLAAADIPSGSTNYIQNISSGTQTANFNISGNGGVGGTFNTAGATTLGSTLGVTGNTTLNGTLSLPSLTTGSVLFTGASGLVSQNNANFFWDNTNNRLGLGTNTPNRTLEVGGTVAASGLSGLRLTGMGAATLQSPLTNVLALNASGDVIVTSNPAANNWLLTGNTGNAGTAFLGNTDDKAMVIKSNNLSYLEFARRQTLGLVQGYTDYTDPDEKVTYIRSAMQFEVPATVNFYKPKMWTTSDGNFRMKGPSAGTDYFEFGATGTNNGGGFEFIIGDDGDEPIVFKSYNYIGPVFTEIMRLQNGNAGINMNGTAPTRNLMVNGTFNFSGSVGTSDRLVGRNNSSGDVATIGLGTTLTLSSNVLDANASSAIWNANQLQGVTVSSTAPTSGQVLTYNGSSWAPAAATGSGWSLTGNAGTAPATNFIGTTDAQPFVIRTNNTEVARVATDGSFGIGLAGATPVKRLHVNANNDAIRITNLSGSGTGNPLVINATGDVKQTTALDGVTVGATTKASGAFTTLTVATSPLAFAAATTTVNNLALPANASFIRITGPTSSFTITGITAGLDGQMITLYNTVNNNMTLGNLNAGSSSANQILTMNGGNVNTNGAGTISLIYSSTDTKWIVTAINQ
ncbi:beta strand repeat-containing protein [Chitinophaga sp. YR573]|uniref:beta strand repeat-containing protein n=1 Tax=Chitinophaga sp. YR573 TaxID=1881040 RepID=UPI000B7E4D91|nr:hypothetical protein [Chitinophaga sp. YR573]